MSVPTLPMSQGVRNRLLRCLAYIETMELERMGWGPEYMRPVERTRASLLSAFGVLLAASDLWIDGVDPSLSLGGVMPGGIVFGMIARERPSAETSATPSPKFTHPEIEWTFHS